MQVVIAYKFFVCVFVFFNIETGRNIITNSVGI